MTKQAKIKTCDICGKSVSDEGEMYIGGHPFHGWFKVNRINGSTTLENLHKNHEWDVCGIECLQKLSKNIDKFENKDSVGEPLFPSIDDTVHDLFKPSKKKKSWLCIKRWYNS